MKKYVGFFIIFVCFFFTSNLNVKAECNYDERKNLLNDAKKVTSYFDLSEYTNSFVFYMYNLTDSIYAEVTNLSNNVSQTIHTYDYDDDYFSFSTNIIDKVIPYKVTIFSNNSSCFGQQLTTSVIKKGIFNEIADDDICTGYEDYYYCQEVLMETTNLSSLEIYSKINDYKKKVEEKNIVIKKENPIIKFIKNYWYYIVGSILLIGLIIVSIIFINKKRGEL